MRIKAPHNALVLCEEFHQAAIDNGIPDPHAYMRWAESNPLSPYPIFGASLIAQDDAFVVALEVRWMEMDPPARVPMLVAVHLVTGELDIPVLGFCDGSDKRDEIRERMREFEPLAIKTAAVSSIERLDNTDPELLAQAAIDIYHRTKTIITSRRPHEK